MIDQSRKERWCAYCKSYIDGYYVDFDNHLEVCESIRAHEIERERNGKNKTDQGNSEMGKI